MFEALENGIGLEIVQGLQSLRNPVFDVIAEIFHLFNNEYLLIGLLAFIFLAFDKRLGWRMFFALILSTFVIYIIKDAFERPRPADVSSAVIPILDQTGYGFPSGHVIITVVLTGTLALWIKRPIMIWLAVILTVIQMFSRMYGGVHFPQDVIAGALIGVGLVLLYRAVGSRLEVWWESQPLALKIGVIVAVTVGVFVISGTSEERLNSAGLLVGGLIATLIEPRVANFTTKGSNLLRLIRYVLGVVIGVGILIGLRAIFASLEPDTVWRMIRYAIVAVVMLSLYPALIVRTKLAERNTPTA